jgi:signal transduction histidine kinase
MRKIIRNITQRYLLALGILTFFSILSFVLYLRTKKATDQYGYLINLSGRQRYFSQRICFLSSELVYNKTYRDSIRAELRRSINQMSKDHQLLLHNYGPIALYYHSPAIDSIYFRLPFRLNKWTDMFLYASNNLVDARNDELNRNNVYFNYILNSSRGLLEGLDSIVAQYQKENDHAVRANYTRRVDMLVGALVAYALIGFFIFLPMTRRIKNTLIDLKRKEDEVDKINKEHLAAIIDAQEKERQSLASELHDGLIQTLTSLSYKLERSTTGDNYPTQEHNDARSLVNEAIRETRNIAYRIVPPMLKEFGLLSAIKVLCKQVTSEYKIPIDVNLYEGEERFSEKLELNLYRITQEALNNSVRHADPSLIKVQLIRHSNSVVLIVEDDGHGFKVSKKKKGIGLINMKERTRMLEGQFHINSSQEMGTEIMVEIPLTDKINSNG